MTATALTPGTTVAGIVTDTPPKHHADRWRLNRAGIVNVWYYYDAEFTFSGGRCVWRGTNGAGKSRALEMLLPFLLDADRRKMDATGAGKVRLEELMRAGGEEQPNRLGYLWLELVGVGDNGDTEYFTSGALVKYSRSTAKANVWYFTTPLRIGIDLALMDERREPLSRDQLSERVGADRVTETPETHRERIRAAVFALTGESGRERYGGLSQLLHTLRSPDVGNRIDEGKLPAILSDALPPLSDIELTRAGEQLDALSETRADQERLDQARTQVNTFLTVYRRYAAGVLIGAADAAHGAAAADRAARRDLSAAANLRNELGERLVAARRSVVELEAAESDLASTIAGIKESKEYADARDLDNREQRVEALGLAADRSLLAAAAARRGEESVVAEADNSANDVIRAAANAAYALRDVRTLLDTAAVPSTLPAEVTAALASPSPQTDVVRRDRAGEPVPLTRPVPAGVTVLPADSTQTTNQARAVGHAATTRAGQAAHRSSVAGDLATRRVRVERAEDRADDAEARAEQASADAAAAAHRRDEAAVALAVSWREWTSDDSTVALLGAVEWRDTPVGALLTDVETLVGSDYDSHLLIELDGAADTAATSAREALTERVAALRAEQDKADRAREDLLTERAELLTARDVVPELAPWHTSVPPDSVPLWRAVDFAPTVGDETRAGIEAALYAAGLLTATVTDGALTAADGQVLVAPTGPLAPTPLSTVLVPDPAAQADPSAVTAVLDRISYRGRSHPVWIDQDGAWGNGLLTGQYHSESARYIGAEARAAVRAARLAEIDTELAALDEHGDRREEERRDIADRRAALTAHLRTAPRTTELANLNALAVEHARRLAESMAEAGTLRATANELRGTWHEANAAHEAACAAARLPVTASELSDVQHAAGTAAGGCERLAQRFEEIVERRGRHDSALERVQEARVLRAAAEDTADQDWSEWQSSRAEFQALRAHVGHTADRKSVV